jgi:hypothetical protein
MKTTTHIYSNGTLTTTVSDKPASREQYASACAVIRSAAQERIAALRAARPLHEDEHIDLMNRVSRVFQTKHKCTARYSDWKVTTMSVAELQDVISRQGVN